MAVGRRRESRRRVLELCYWMAPDENLSPEAMEAFIDRGTMPSAALDIDDPDAQALLAKVAAFRARVGAGAQSDA